MEEKIKQRIIGITALLGVVFVVLPFLFYKPTVAQQPVVVNNQPVLPPTPVTNVAPSVTTPISQPSSPSPVAFNPTPIKPLQQAAPPTVQSPAVATAAHVVSKPITAQAVGASKSVTLAPVASKPVTIKTDDTLPAVSKSLAQTASKSAVKEQVHHSAALMGAKIPEAWTIQLGVFSNQKHADELVAKLRTKHFEAYTHAVSKDGNHLVAIYVGPELRLEKMKTIQSEIKREFHLNGFIKRYHL